MTPFESASLSLSDWEGWLRPTVGGSPFTSGGQAGGAEGRTSAWANAVPAEMMLAHRAIERVATRKRWVPRVPGSHQPVTQRAAPQECSAVAPAKMAD